ncbi:unnamed protein product [Pylaiella littoralis]
MFSPGGTWISGQAPEEGESTGHGLLARQQQHESNIQHPQDAADQSQRPPLPAGNNYNVSPAGSRHDHHSFPAAGEMRPSGRRRSYLAQGLRGLSDSAHQREGAQLDASARHEKEKEKEKEAPIRGLARQLSRQAGGFTNDAKSTPDHHTRAGGGGGSRSGSGVAPGHAIKISSGILGSIFPSSTPRVSHNAGSEAERPVAPAGSGPPDHTAIAPSSAGGGVLASIIPSSLSRPSSVESKAERPVPGLYSTPSHARGCSMGGDVAGRPPFTPSHSRTSFSTSRAERPIKGEASASASASTAAPAPAVTTSFRPEWLGRHFRNNSTDPRQLEEGGARAASWPASLKHPDTPPPLRAEGPRAILADPNVAPGMKEQPMMDAEKGETDLMIGEIQSIQITDELSLARKAIVLIIVGLVGASLVREYYKKPVIANNMDLRTLVGFLSTLLLSYPVIRFTVRFFAFIMTTKGSALLYKGNRFYVVVALHQDVSITIWCIVAVSVWKQLFSDWVYPVDDSRDIQAVYSYGDRLLECLLALRVGILVKNFLVLMVATTYLWRPYLERVQSSILAQYILLLLTDFATKGEFDPEDERFAIEMERQGVKGGDNISLYAVSKAMGFIPRNKLGHSFFRELGGSDTLESSKDAKTLGTYLFSELFLRSRPPSPPDTTAPPSPVTTRGLGAYLSTVGANVLGVGGGAQNSGAKTVRGGSGNGPLSSTRSLRGIGSGSSRNVVNPFSNLSLRAARSSSDTRPGMPAAWLTGGGTETAKAAAGRSSSLSLSPTKRPSEGSKSDSGLEFRPPGLSGDGGRTPREGGGGRGGGGSGSISVADRVSNKVSSGITKIFSGSTPNSAKKVGASGFTGGSGSGSGAGAGGDSGGKGTGTGTSAAAGTGAAAAAASDAGVSLNSGATGPDAALRGFRDGRGNDGAGGIGGLGGGGGSDGGGSGGGDDGSGLHVAFGGFGREVDRSSSGGSAAVGAVGEGGAVGRRKLSVIQDDESFLLSGSVGELGGEEEVDEVSKEEQEEGEAPAARGAGKAPAAPAVAATAATRATGDPTDAVATEPGREPVNVAPAAAGTGLGVRVSESGRSDGGDDGDAAGTKKKAGAKKRRVDRRKNFVSKRKTERGKRRRNSEESGVDEDYDDDGDAGAEGEGAGREVEEVLTRATLCPGLDQQLVDCAMKIFDGNENGSITEEEMVVGVVGVFRDHRSLVATLKDSEHIARKLGLIIMTVILFILIFVWLSIWGADVVSLSLTFASFLIAFSFMIGTSASNLTSAVLFIFVARLYDVGDRVHIYDGSNTVGVKPMDVTVVKVDLNSTSFKRWDEQIFYMPNHLLATKTIVNIQRTADQWHEFMIQVAASTSPDKLKALHKALQSFAESKNKSEGLYPRMGFSLVGIEDSTKLTIRVTFRQRANWQNMEKKWACQSMCTWAIKNACDSLRISYFLPFFCFCGVYDKCLVLCLARLALFQGKVALVAAFVTFDECLGFLVPL